MGATEESPAEFIEPGGARYGAIAFRRRRTIQPQSACSTDWCTTPALSNRRAPSPGNAVTACEELSNRHI